MRSSTLRDWYEGLSAAKVRGMVGTEQESRLLDFKLVRGADLSDSKDRQTLAEAISGFSNAEGGVIVWGVDARKNPKNQAVDEVVSAPGVQHPRLLLSRLSELTPGAASPAPIGVDHRVLGGRGGPSFVATFIPQSSYGPVMAKSGSDRYFTRSASSFVRLEHYQLADLFARIAAPKIEVEANWQHRGDGLSRVLLALRNVGTVGAVAPFLLFRVQDPYLRFDMGIDGNGRNMLPYGGAHPDGWHMHAGGTNQVIHPTLDAWIGAAFKGYDPNRAIFAGRPCVIEYRAGALGAPLVQGTVVADPETGEITVSQT